MKVIYHAVKTRSYKECSDAALFKIMADKDKDYLSAQKAFAEIDARYRKYILKVCWIYCKSREAVLEITKDTLYKAFSNAPKYKNGKSTKAWLGTMAQNAVFDFKKGRKNKIVMVLDEYPESTPEATDTTWGSRLPLEKEKLLAALNEMDDHKRDVLEAYLRHFDIKEFGDKIRLPDYEVEFLCSTYPHIIKDKYYIPKLRDRAWEELYDKCMDHNQN
ncbi:MAG TPA: sigma factor [Chitinophagaceae bacterium]|nr:sigma factor [Chitinophagaceae bacterium]